MSLENVIAENTQAINNLAELIRQAMHMMPPTAPAPVTPQAAPDNGIHVPPKPAPAPQAVAQPAPAPEAPVDYVALRKALMQKVMQLFSQSVEVGKQILSSFGAQRLSDVPDDKLVAFATSVDKALAGV